MTWRRLCWASVLLLTVIGVGSWWTGHAPVALLAASYVALLGLLSRVLPTRVAVPAALVAQQAVLLGLELLVPVVLGGPLRPGVALGILLVPVLAVLPDLRLGDDESASVDVRWPYLSALLGGAVVVAVVRDRVAWTASGDSRNHYLFTRLVIREGGLHGDAFTWQPLHQDSLTALLVSTHGRGALSPGELLEHDLHVLALTSLAMVVVWTLTMSAALWSLASFRGAATWVVVAVGSLLPLTGLGLGILLRDGFLSILVLAPVLICTLSVLAWLATTDRRGTGRTVAVGISAAAIPLVAFTWTPHAVVVGAAALVPWWRALRSGEHRGIRLGLMLAGIGTGAAYYVYVVTEAADRLVDAYGSIAAPPPWLVAAVPGLVAVIAVARLSSVPTLAFAPYLVGSGVALLITVVAVVMQQDGHPWSYFPAKFAWVWLLAGLPLLLTPFAHPRRDGWAWAPASVVVLVAAVVVSPVASPLRAIDDWTNPDEASLALAADLGHVQTRYVVYHVDPPEDRLTNFWLVPYDGETGPSRDNVFFMWAYTKAGTAQDVCELLDEQPDRVVATTDPKAENRLRRFCGHPVSVRLVEN